MESQTILHNMKVCFIGHRKIENEEEIRQRLLNVVTDLIMQGADTFLFGSRSEFDSLCWETVTELKTQYPNIRRISYNTPHECSFTSQEEREKFEQICFHLTGKEEHFSDYESAVKSQKSINATRDTYVMRNQEMIDNSDVCVFYYNKDYLPPRRKQSKRYVADYQPKSGTAVAFAYAKQKKKIIINLYNN